MITAPIMRNNDRNTLPRQISLDNSTICILERIICYHFYANNVDYIRRSSNAACSHSIDCDCSVLVLLVFGSGASLLNDACFLYLVWFG